MANRKKFLTAMLAGILMLVSVSSVFASAPIHSIPTDSSRPAAAVDAIDTSGLSTLQRITRIENQMQYLMSLAQQVKQQQQQIAILTGQIEMLQHQAKQWVKNQKSLHRLDQRLVKLETKQTLSKTRKANKASVSEKDINKGQSQTYKKAFNHLMSKQYKEATQGFKHFVKAYPKSNLLGNAHYWLGELYLVQGQPNKASQQFRLVIRNPRNIKTPDAMFKLGSISFAFGDITHAKAIFQKLIKQYPGTNAAKLAEKKLKAWD